MPGSRVGVSAQTIGGPIRVHRARAPHSAGNHMTRIEFAPGIAIHTHACGEGGIFVNAYLVETRNGIVAIDSTLTETESKSFRKEVEHLAKPLLAVLVTHPHPDHVAGITNLIGGDQT